MTWNDLFSWLNWTFIHADATSRPGDLWNQQRWFAKDGCDPPSSPEEFLEIERKPLSMHNGVLESVAFECVWVGILGFPSACSCSHVCVCVETEETVLWICTDNITAHWDSVEKRTTTSRCGINMQKKAYFCWLLAFFFASFSTDPNLSESLSSTKTFWTSNHEEALLVSFKATAVFIANVM